MSKRTCPICKKEYDDGGDVWKKFCYDCYKNYTYLSRGTTGRLIKGFYKCNIYISHPSVTEEEAKEIIKTKFKDVGWGAQELKPEEWSKFKIWIDNMNFD